MEKGKTIVILLAVTGVVLAYFLTRKTAVGAAGMTTAFSGLTPSPTPGGVRTYTTTGTPVAGPLTNLLNLFKPAGNVGFTNQGPMPPPTGVQAPSTLPVAGSSDVLQSVGSAVAGASPAPPIDLGTGIDTPVSSWDDGMVDYSTGFNVADANPSLVEA